jgi:glycerate-2-kinase
VSIYLDSGATTRLHPGVLDAMMPFLAGQWHSPAGAYRSSVRVRDAVEQARSEVADLIGATPEEIVFTSGGTEANNTALKSLAREVGRTLGHIAAYHARHDQRLCLLAGGETTVTIRGNGLGGRNQELALGAALSIQNIPNLICAAYASDGGDGPSDAAGAVVDGNTIARAKVAGQDALAALARNDSYYFFDAIADLLKPGATGTNVNDLFVALL